MRLRKKFLRGLIAVTQRIGTKLRNREGGAICRAFVFHWGGNLHLIGLPNNVQLRPVPLPQLRLSYWRQTVTWEQAGPPDFPRLGKPAPTEGAAKVCHVVICHLPPAETALVFRTWQDAEPEGVVLVAYGGTRESFLSLPSEVNAVFVPDGSLRTTDHARQRQQYAGVFRVADEWLSASGDGITHVHVVEFDVVSTTGDLGRKLAEILREEDADVAGFGLVDLSGTVHPQYRHQLTDGEFLDFLQNLSARENRARLIGMLGCSSIWRRACFEEVARLQFLPAVYLEVAMPTLAHHLGYRVRPMPRSQENFVTFEGDLSDKLEAYRDRGAWLVHPCKAHWKSARRTSSFTS